MTIYTSPVPLAGPDAVAPEAYREIYPMPMFLNVLTDDLAASKEFWLRGLGFIDLFTIPGTLTHLRRWAFQDVLLHAGEQPREAPPASISFSCVLYELEQIAERCEKLLPGCTTGPVDQPWNSRELTIVTPENARVTMTAAKVHDPDSQESANIRAIGIEIPFT